MANAAFDTLTVSKDLQSAGFEAKQAEAIALAVKQAQGDLATKQDIALLKTELKSDIDQVRTELKSGIKQLKTDIGWIRWVVGANLALSIAIIGAIIVT